MSRVADPKAKIALLRAAEETFAERGLGGAKIEDIAKRAGLSKGAFYLHFESKEVALKQIVESWLARCASHFAAPSEYPELTTEDADSLVDFCIERDVRIYEFLWQTRATMRILRSCQGEYDYLVDAFKADIQRRNREWLEQWRSEGLVRPNVDIELAATLISGAYEELSLKLIRSPVRPPLERWLEFAQETFLRAYGTTEMIRALDRRSRRSSVDELEVHPPAAELKDVMQTDGESRDGR